MRDHCPPALGGSGAVPGRTRVDGTVTRAHGDTSQECEHRCRKCGLGAKAGSRPRVKPPGTRRTQPTAQDTPDPAGRGRPAHVRSRLIIAVAVVAAAIAGAGAPSVITASSDLNDSQNLVTLAGRTQDALALAHSLADERDEVTSYIAAGRPDGQGPLREPQRPRRPAGRRAPRGSRRGRRARGVPQDPRRHRHRPQGGAHRREHRTRSASGVLRRPHRTPRSRRGTGRAAPAPRGFRRALPRRPRHRRPAGRLDPRPAPRGPEHPHHHADRPQTRSRACPPRPPRRRPPTPSSATSSPPPRSSPTSVSRRRSPDSARPRRRPTVPRTTPR